MKTLRGSLVTAMAAGALIVVPVSSTRLPRAIGPRGVPDPQALYGPNAKEFYLASDYIGYIRPGFHITVNSIDGVPRKVRLEGRSTPTATSGRVSQRAGARAF